MYFEPKEYELAGRIGKLRTRHGVIETPFLFPVVDPVRQAPGLSVLREIGYDGFITNAYLFYKRNNGEVKDIHQALNWDKPIMTDSGGYQVLVYGDVEVDNKTIVEYEKKIGVDIGVILDVPTGSKMTWDEALKAVRETYKRAVEALPLIMDSDQVWVLPIQGSPYKDLLVRSSIQAWRLPYQMYAIGSPTLLLERYEYSVIVEITALAKLHLSPDRPLHVFGVGHPMIIPFLVAMGADFFDSASYILYARDGRYMTETGTKNVKDLTYLPCNCPVCSRYTAEELKELGRREREELIATHNLHVLMKELRNVKQHIREGRLWELLEYRSKSHPSLKRAFHVVKKYRELLEKYNPRSKPDGKALMIIDRDSLENPRLVHTRRRSLQVLESQVRGKKIILIPAHSKPFSHQPEYLKLKVNHAGVEEEFEALFIHPALGVFHPSLSPTYPFYQHEGGITRGVLNHKLMARLIDKLLEKTGAQELIIVESSWMSRELFERIKESSSHGDKMIICSLDEISSRLARSP
ncbi:tRNA guanosine(15) transglycosylase TgtA [Thermosphaera aggregans]|uniref:tRNA-guanine(15) transglycosylase n=1 Tax=Thermosphaera aggregans (strain DSM 11486 / M11TL) TaxID=633148 RepID=D5U346_THEAM|nr:tRNA guanosine(15) transglycosylase TgtA [Thermosphaera aggregans]ADG91546.1 archaeosine tRNA-ribosyltransferase [Thermosphaera aggregans DSM 11486]